MEGIYTPFLIILMMSGLSLSQHHVCLKYKDMVDTIEIMCSIDRLIHQIGFKNPAGEENGNCEAPIRIGKGIVECSKRFNINQDLTTNTTTLIIKKSELKYGEWKCYHGTNIGSDSVDIKMPGQHICLKYKDMGDTIDIMCSIDRLIHQIVFKNPAGQESGNCEAPIWIGKRVECSKQFNINQDLTTNTTTLIIKKNELKYGEWKCYHGTNIGSDSVDIKMSVSNPRWDLIVPLIITVVLLILLACHRGYQFVVSRKGKTECLPKCTSCSQDSIGAICIDCKKMFCEICWNTHNRSKPDHKLFIIEHLTIPNYEVNCEYCDNMATIGCLRCVVVFCNDCKREHLETNHDVKMLIKSNIDEYRRGNMEDTPILEHKYTSVVPVEPITFRRTSPNVQKSSMSSRLTVRYSDSPVDRSSDSPTD